jgi:hypothetical protein
MCVGFCACGVNVRGKKFFVCVCVVRVRDFSCAATALVCIIDILPNHLLKWLCLIGKIVAFWVAKISQKRSNFIPVRLGIIHPHQ